MLISVVICTYNGEKYLEEQLRSVMNQTYKKLEIIINDDCSTDNTLEVAKVLQAEDKRIKIYKNETNLGFNKNFETSLKYAEGELISLCDQDDIWVLDKIERQYNLLKKENSSLVYCNANLIDAEGKDLEKNLFQQLHVTPISGDTQLGLIYDNCISGNTLMFKKSLLDKIYPIPEKIFFDRWIGFVASYEGPVSVIKESLIYYRQHGGNVTDVLREKKKKKTLKMRIEKRQAAFEIKVEQFEAFLAFFKRNNIENESTRVIGDMYSEIKTYKNYFFSFTLFFIYLKNKEKIFQIKGNKFAAMFKFSCGLKMYKLFPYL
jgi:glycosyltransferase involved in cell wall biosynthesis